VGNDQILEALRLSTMSYCWFSDWFVVDNVYCRNDCFWFVVDNIYCKNDCFWKKMV